MTPHDPGERPPPWSWSTPTATWRRPCWARPPGAPGDVVALDLADLARPFGLNLLDTGLGWSRDKAAWRLVRLFRREFDQFWGRMEDAFRFALLTLYEANEALPGGPRQAGAQLTVLQVPTVLADALPARLLRRCATP